MLTFKASPFLVFFLEDKIPGQAWVEECCHYWCSPSPSCGKIHVSLNEQQCLLSIHVSLIIPFSGEETEAQRSTMTSL